jgi:hypothetical protein
MDDESPKQRVEELIGGLLAKQLTTFFAAAGSRSKTPEWLADRPPLPGENSMASGIKRSNDQLIRFPVPLCAALFAATEASSGRLDVAFATLDKTLISLRKCIGNWVSY